MATRKNNGGPDGAGSILSTIAGPADPKRPAGLGATTPESERLIEKVVSDQAQAAEMPFNSTKPREYGEDAIPPHEGERHARPRRWPPPAPPPRTSPPARPATARPRSAPIP
ncbi:MAG: catalase [Massilia sp.]|jgi:catalase